MLGFTITDVASQKILYSFYAKRFYSQRMVGQAYCSYRCLILCLCVNAKQIVLNFPLKQQTIKCLVYNQIKTFIRAFRPKKIFTINQLQCSEGSLQKILSSPYFLLQFLKCFFRGLRNFLEWNGTWHRRWKLKGGIGNIKPFHPV